MSLDNPKCRFDACVALTEPYKPQGEIGEKKLPAGSQTFDEIFSRWYPSSFEKLADAPSFCEYVDLHKISLDDSQRITKIYIPLTSR